MLPRQCPRQGHVRATVVQQQLDELLVDAAAAAAASCPIRAVPRVRNAGAAVVIDALHIGVGLKRRIELKSVIYLNSRVLLVTGQL